MPEAFVTLATNDAYCMGCLVVGKCLRRHGTTRKLVAMVSSSVSKEARSSLKDVFDELIEVDVLDSRDKAHLAWLGRPELGVTFSKLHCWTLTYYTKCVFLDADTLVLCNVDELFEREELSAAPDVGWPDCFNSGVFVFRPSLETHSRLLGHAITHGSFDGGDQGLLNSFFSEWAIKDINKHLPFIYNLSASSLYTYLPAFHKYSHQAKIVHFLGGNKPWHLPYNQQLSSDDVNRTLGHYVNLWWAEYYTDPNVKKLHEQQDSVLFKHPLECPHPASHLQSQEPDSHVQDREDTSLEDKSLSQEIDELTLSASVSNTSDQLEKETDSEPHPECEPDPEPHPECEPHPEPHPECWPDPEPHPESWPDPEPHPECWPDPEPHPECWPDPEPHPESWPDPEPHPECWPDPEPHPECEPDPEPHPECEPDPEPHPECEPDPEPHPEPVTTGHTEDFSPKQIQEFGQEGISEPEAAEDPSPALAVAESDTASGESSEESLAHRRRWEAGHIDYMGRDAFENIRRKLDQFLS